MPLCTNNVKPLWTPHWAKVTPIYHQQSWKQQVGFCVLVLCYRKILQTFLNELFIFLRASHWSRLENMRLLFFLLTTANDSHQLRSVWTKSLLASQPPSKQEWLLFAHPTKSPHSRPSDIAAPSAESLKDCDQSRWNVNKWGYTEACILSCLSTAS